jgi:predicted nucleic acid-binding protein
VADAYVVDTSVFVRWYVEQVGFEHALEVQQQFLSGAVALETVDFVRVEVAEVLRRKGLVQGLLDRDSYLGAVRDIDELDVVIHETDMDALTRAAALAAKRSLRVYDALLVDRAIDRGLPLLTADARLCRAVEAVVSTELLTGIASEAKPT